MLQSSTIKHVLHCILLTSFIVFSFIMFGAIQLNENNHMKIDPWAEYGAVARILIYISSIASLTALPYMVCVFLGLIVFKAFPDKTVLNISRLPSSTICIRVVTRGNYPELVIANVFRNMSICVATGLENFIVEVVTSNKINMPKNKRIREIVVPENYETKTRALFKARSLQYCLEDNVNILSPNDWVVHLNEETILTENSVKGIINFILDGKYPFGQGLITFANEGAINYLTLADCFRIADDMGRIKFLFKTIHRPLFGWKGSFMVSQLHAERSVSFDHGADGSIVEDLVFALKASSQGYLFGWIEGDMLEKSPTRTLDFLQQRKRWIQGILLIVESKIIPFKYKFWFWIMICSWCNLPLAFLMSIFSLPCPLIISFINAFLGWLGAYVHVFGVLKSISLYRFSLFKSIACIIGTLCAVPFNFAVFWVAIVWGVMGKKHNFYVVRK